jgi:hypothetical protein
MERAVLREAKDYLQSPIELVATAAVGVSSLHYVQSNNANGECKNREYNRRRGSYSGS